VRDLFRAAKSRAPCVIFIDEIDSVGSKRTNSVLHPYANQTINQVFTKYVRLCLRLPLLDFFYFSFCQKWMAFCPMKELLFLVQQTEQKI